MRNHLRLLMIPLVIIFVTGCFSQAKSDGNFFAVQPGKVAEFKKMPEEKVDVFVPLRDQYANSDHAKALSDLKNYKDQSHVQDYCYNCHSAEYRLAPDGAKPLVKQLSSSITCVVCHDMTMNEFRLRTTPFETCANCHWAVVEIKPGALVNHPQKEMFSGKGALEVGDKPSTKYSAGLTCIECHMPNQSHTFQALTPSESIKQRVGSTCMMCHTKVTTEEFADKVEILQEQTVNRIKKLKMDLETLKTTIDNLTRVGRNVEEAQMMYNIVLTNVSFVEADGSKGVHNTEYTNDILALCDKKIANAKLLLGY